MHNLKRLLQVDKSAVILTLAAALMLISMLPFILNPIPIQTDLFYIMGRMYVARHVEDIPALAKYYLVDWQFSTNTAVELFLYAAQNWMSVFRAANLYVCIAMATLVVGFFHFQYRLFGQISYFALLVFPFLYNFPFAWGFVNFYLSLGLTLNFLAFLLILQHRRLTFLISFFFFSLLMFIVHLIGWALFVFSSVTLFFTIVFKEKGLVFALKESILTACVMGIMPLILMQYLPSANWYPLTTEYGNFITRIMAILSGVLYFDYSTDIELFALILLLPLLRIVKIAPVLRPLLVSAALISLLIPLRLWGVLLTDTRLPSLVWLLFIASFTYSPQLNKKHHAIVSSIVCGLLIITSVNRMGSILNQHRECSHVATAYISDIKANTISGKKIIDFIDYSAAPRCGFPKTLSHISNLALISNQLFIPTLVTGVPPISVKPEFHEISGPESASPDIGSLDLLTLKKQEEEILKLPPEALEEKDFIMDWPKKYDYVVVHWVQEPKERINVPSFLQALATGPGYTLYRNNYSGKK